MQAETFVSVRECWEKYGTDDSIVTINKSIDEMRSTGLNGCWNKLWPQPAGKNKDHHLVDPLTFWHWSFTFNSNKSPT
jgi:hypothetical protein